MVHLVSSKAYLIKWLVCVLYTFLPFTAGNTVYMVLGSVVLNVVFSMLLIHVVQTGRHGCGNRERSTAHLEGCASSRLKESIH